MADDINNPQDNPPEDPPVSGEAAPKDNLLTGTKTQLAMGAAATLGVMILYKLRAKMLAKEDPESYAQIREITAAVRDYERNERTGEDRRRHKAEQQRRAKERRSRDRREGAK
jgi:hypothetical protein